MSVPVQYGSSLPRNSSAASAPQGPPAAPESPPNHFELQRRPLTAEEADQITRSIRDSPNITGYSPREWCGRRDTFVLVDRSRRRIAGALLTHHLAGTWSEIAVVFLFEEYRGRGLGRELLQGALRTLTATGRRYLLFFSSPHMERIASASGFRIYADEAAFVAGSARRKLFLKVIYKAQWLASVYRLREIRRKRAEFSSAFDFKVGVLTTGGAK
ncbi:GNAT family N-acetyltransferase [Streptomyces sp. B-S-A8]|uniref:GNAT family N-acetyltransferase n=1 Tax=Streptomyces solicavernae TaxID=3043614 RepID=A0ABT6RY37_9ACTN|nr:GNAT family N-acetyltransferase [Streptomyces sp. B-S-A8]MDI3389352.1 GNAT family N-acetyltransferase [Streptomyces sp. B-S-A8]